MAVKARSRARLRGAGYFTLTGQSSLPRVRGRPDGREGKRRTPKKKKKEEKKEEGQGRACRRAARSGGGNAAQELWPLFEDKVPEGVPLRSRPTATVWRRRSRSRRATTSGGACQGDARSRSALAACEPPPSPAEEEADDGMSTRSEGGATLWRLSARKGRANRTDALFLPFNTQLVARSPALNSLVSRPAVGT